MGRSPQQCSTALPPVQPPRLGPPPASLPGLPLQGFLPAVTSWDAFPNAATCDGLYFKIPRAGVPSYCGSPRASTNFTGGDLPCPGLPGGLCRYVGLPSVAACCEKCHAMTACGAFTLRWDDAAHTTGTCALKRATGYTATNAAGHVSAAMAPSAGAVLRLLRMLHCWPCMASKPRLPLPTRLDLPPPLLALPPPRAGCPNSTTPWARDAVGGPTCAAIKAGCAGVSSVYQELLRFQGQDTYCCRCLATDPRAPDAACPADWRPEEECEKLPYWCTTPTTGQYNEIMQPSRCCICSALGDPLPGIGLTFSFVGPGGGATWTLHSEALLHDASEAACIADGGHLATFDSKEEVGPLVMRWVGAAPTAGGGLAGLAPCWSPAMQPGHGRPGPAGIHIDTNAHAPPPPRSGMR